MRAVLSTAPPSTALQRPMAWTSPLRPVSWMPAPRRPLHHGIPSAVVATKRSGLLRPLHRAMAALVAVPVTSAPLHLAKGS
ncbi:hypothetical protein U9M48_007403 [Paspalum notatum var. saurae]|uniref:Uncharacterized protein n=1 Tax=Paspalum notatum var. saurae TaxID=547442 RepID=A0AAQ3SL40_PASNO